MFIAGQFLRAEDLNTLVKNYEILLKRVSTLEKEFKDLLERDVRPTPPMPIALIEQRPIPVLETSTFFLFRSQNQLQGFRSPIRFNLRDIPNINVEDSDYARIDFEDGKPFLTPLRGGRTNLSFQHDGGEMITQTILLHPINLHLAPLIHLKHVGPYGLLQQTEGIGLRDYGPEPRRSLLLATNQREGRLELAQFARQNLSVFFFARSTNQQEIRISLRFPDDRRPIVHHYHTDGIAQGNSMYYPIPIEMPEEVSIVEYQGACLLAITFPEVV